MGENAAPIREKIIKTLGHMGFAIDPQLNDSNSLEKSRNISGNKQPILVIRGDEERYIAEEVEKLISTYSVLNNFPSQ